MLPAAASRRALNRPPRRPAAPRRYALTGKEVTSILMQRLVAVDGKVRTDKTFPVGFMDVVTIPKTDEHFRLVYDAKGRFVVHRISKEEAAYKLCKVRRVQFGKGGVPFIATHDGRTIRYPDPDIKVRWPGEERGRGVWQRGRDRNRVPKDKKGPELWDAVSGLGKGSRRAGAVAQWAASDKKGGGKPGQHCRRLNPWPAQDDLANNIGFGG